MITARCSWLEGPDVEIEIENQDVIILDNPTLHTGPDKVNYTGISRKAGIYLSAEQAEALAQQLIKAAEEAKKQEKEVNEYFGEKE